MKTQIKILALALSLAVIGCKKREVNFNYSVVVQDFYTNEFVEGQTVVLELCEENGGGFQEPVISCSLIDEKKTDNAGKVSYSGSFIERNRSGHHVYSDTGNGYFSTVKRSIRPDSSNVIIYAKPFVPIQLSVTSSTTIDSLAILVSVRELHELINIEDFGIAANDTTISSFLGVPEEEHFVEVWAFENEALVWEEVSIFFPSYDQNNLLEVKK
jgi:hypothetical protein